MNKAGKISLITLGILTVYSGIYFVLVPQILSSNFVKTKLETEILKQTGFSLTLNDYKIRTAIAPEIRFKAKNIRLQNDKDCLIIHNINTKINWLSILTGNISVRRFVADEISLTLFDDYSEKILNPKVLELVKHLRAQKVKINNLSLDLNNQKLIKDIKILGSDIVIAKFNPHKRIKLTANTQILEKENSGYINLQTDLRLPLSPKNIKRSEIRTNINHLNLNTFSKSIHALTPEVEALNGIVDLNINKNPNELISLDLLSNGLYLKFANKDLPISHTKPIEVKGLVYTEDDKIVINSLKINSELLNSSLLGSIDLKDKRNPDLNLSLSVDKSSAAEMVRLLPPEKDLMPELNFLAMKRSNFNGDAMAHLEITGKALRPMLNGNILITNAYLVKPIKNAQKATIKLIFNQDKMTLETNVPTAPKERVWANGVFDLYDEKKCTLNVKSTQNINLETAQIILNPLQEIIKIDFGPVPMMKILGLGNIDINVNGNVKDPHITGIFNYKNAQVSFIDMPNLIIKNASGDLKFTDTETYFKTASATLNSRPINVEGSCNLQGVFNYIATTKDQNLTKLLNDIQGNTLLADLNTYFDQIESIKGLGDLNLNIYGVIKDINNIEFNKNIFSKGKISLNAVTIKPKAVPQAISNIFGDLTLDNKDIMMNLFALINKSKVTIDGKIKDNDANILVKTKDFRIIDAVSTLPLDLQRTVLTLIKSSEFMNLIPTICTNFTAKYKGTIDNIQPQNLEVYGTLFSDSNPNFKKSNYELTNSTLKFSPIKIHNKDINFETAGVITNLFNAKRSISGSMSLKDFNLNLINISTLKNIEPLKPLTASLENLSGQININAASQNNKLWSTCDLRGIKITENKRIHEILSGTLQLKNDTLFTNNINARFFEMPILLNGKISLANKNLPTYNFRLNTKPTQEFINTCFNQNALYPIKVKGNLTLNAEISGNTKISNIKSNLLLDKDSTIYYMGATLGDKSNAVKLTSNLTLNGNEVKINNFNYDKVVLSLDKNETTVPLLNIAGGMTYLKDNVIGFNNLKIQSQMPVDAKIFNIIFRKPFMKEGVFTSNLTLNGNSLNPHILGKLNITDINIPLVETNINKINLDFTPKLINLSSNGDLLTNKIKLNATLRNNLTPPLIIDNLNIHVARLDMNKIIEKIKHIEETNFKMHTSQAVIQPLDYTNLIINNSEISADTILIDKITANNYLGRMEINKDKILKIKDFNFDLAEGKVNGTITHNYNNDNLKIDLNLNRANAAQMAETLFNIKGQLYGLANGKMSLVCTAKNDKICLATLSGTGNFDIQDGKMPKLGSLEYLLKAGNLITGGISGITINGLIDLLSPLKSGEFKTISGDFKMENGIAEEINIYSSGKDLNLYITGKYNLSTAVADFKIFGSLSKDITTVFNKVKNMSLNTLLKTIPGVKKEKETSFDSDIAKIPNANDVNNIYKFFRVIINGDINGENFVKSFEWIESGATDTH